MKFHTDIVEAYEWPVVLGHFLPWYTIRGDDYPLQASDATTLDWLPEIEDLRHWSDGRADYRRTHLHMPEIGIYDSRNPLVIEWQIRTALEHGVNGFILNWYGMYSVENVLTLHWLRGLDQWNATHPEQPFAYCFSYDMQAQWPSEGKRPVSIEEDFFYIRRHLLRPGYLRRDGRPVFTVFPYGDERSRFRRALDRAFAPTGADLIWSGASPSAGEDARYAWVKPDSSTVNADKPCAWSDPDNCGENELRLFYETANSPGSLPLYLMHGVWPEFNNALVAWAWSKDPNHPGIRPSVICRQTRDGATLERTWRPYLDYLRRARAGGDRARVPAPLVQLVTWNDYAETTTLEPSREFGREPLACCKRHIEEARAVLTT